VTYATDRFRVHCARVDLHKGRDERSRLSIADQPSRKTRLIARLPDQPITIRYLNWSISNATDPLRAGTCPSETGPWIQWIVAPTRSPR